MSALAGCAGANLQSLEEACGHVLRALSFYGTARKCVRSLEGAAFGLALHETLPDDEFDDQPLSGGQRFLLAADIRIDNRSELARRLRLPRVAQHSDSSLLLKAWMEWGNKALDHIVGDYAFALYDRQERSLTLARDPTGQRPLYYALQGDTFVFASMVSGILNCPLISTGIDFGSMAQMVGGIGAAGSSTYFRGVARVEAGQMLVWSPSGLAKHWHWNPPQDYLQLPADDYVAAYRALLGESVAAAARRKSGLLGVHLSSGWDSSAVAATAAMTAVDGTSPVAYTAAPRLGFDRPVPRACIADESGLARLLAAQHKLEHCIVRPDRGVLDGLRDHVRYFQEPNFNLANMQWITQIHEAARTRGVSTLLTGEMGNLSLNAGGLPALAEWLQSSEWSTWWKQARAATRESKARWGGVLSYSFERQIPPGVLHLLERTFRGAPSFAAQSFAREEWLRGDRSSPPAEDGIGVQSHYQSRLAQVRSNDVGNFRKGTLARFGIDERDPTADRRLLDFSFSLPPDQLLNMGEWRPLARRALADRVPQAILNSAIRGYQGADWFERIGPVQARELLEDISSNSTVRDLLDLKKIERAIDRWPEGGWEQQRRIQIYRTRIPIALATGVFIQEFAPMAARARSI